MSSGKCLEDASKLRARRAGVALREIKVSVTVTHGPYATVCCDSQYAMRVGTLDPGILGMAEGASCYDIPLSLEGCAIR